MKPWYEELFTNFARTYDRQPFTQGTAGECDFLEAEVGGDRSKRILDVGCGTGRHSIELARRGYDVTGVDLSADQLARAREKAREAGVRVRFLRRDARRLRTGRKYDLVVLLCEAGFSLMETDEENHRILAGAARALAPGGKLVLTALNALYPLRRSVKDLVNDGAVGTVTEGNAFDLVTFRERATVTVTDDSGATKTLETSERFWAPSELSWHLSSLGLEEVSIHGCDLGAYSRARPPTPDDFELLAIARRPRDD